MKPEKFKEANKTLTGERCKPLPVYTEGNYCASRWRLTWKERLRVLFTGRLWLYVLSGHNQPPVRLGFEGHSLKELTNE